MEFLIFLVIVALVIIASIAFSRINHLSNQLKRINQQMIYLETKGLLPQGSAGFHWPMSMPNPATYPPPGAYPPGRPAYTPSAGFAQPYSANPPAQPPLGAEQPQPVSGFHPTSPPAPIQPPVQPSSPSGPIHRSVQWPSTAQTLSNGSQASAGIPQKDFTDEFPKDTPNLRLVESWVGKNIIGIAASVLIFIGLIFLGVLIYEHLTDTIKIIAMFAISTVLTVTGTLLLRKKSNNFTMSLTGCGAGSLFLFC